MSSPAFDQAGAGDRSDSERHVDRLTRTNHLLGGVVVVLVLALAVVVIWAMSNSGTGAELQRDVEATQQTVEGLNAAVEAADVQAVGAFFAEDASYEDPAAGMAVEGRSRVESMFGSFLSTESPIDNTAVFVGPDFAVTEFVWTQPCTFAACSDELFMEPVEVRGIVLLVVDDGEVVRETDYIAYPRKVLLTPP